jgi:putative two-component system response regulator
MRTMQYMHTLIDAMLRNGLYAEIISTWDLDYYLPSTQLHDMGKIAVTDTVLNKPGKLTLEEFEIIKTHVEVGVDAVEKMSRKVLSHAFLLHAKAIIGSHHEKWDGTGYPKGLKGTDIPLEGRLMSIVDVYDALVSERPYKKAFPPDVSAQIILKCEGTYFEPALVAVFKQVKDEFAKIAREII